MKSIFSFLLLLAGFTCIAQINYEPGSFTLNNGTVTNCLIKNIAWKNNPISFTYKLTENEAEKQGSIQEVVSFEVSGYKFERHTVQLERSQTTVGYLENSAKPNYKTETLYLKKLVEGAITLYSFEESNVRKYFFSTAENTLPQQLLYKKYEEGLKVKEYKHYQYQLSTAMADAKFGESTFNRLNYNLEALTKLVIKYNTTKGAVVDNTEKHNKTKFALKVTIGAYIASLETKLEVPQNFNDDHTFSNKVIFSGGLEAEYTLPFNNNKWSVFVNPEYSAYENNELKPVTPGDNQLTGWNAKFAFVTVPVGVRYYMFLNQKSRIFVNAAYVMAFKAGNATLRNRFTVYDVSGAGNFLFGAGYSYNGKYGIEFRCNTSRDLMETVYRSAKYTSAGVVLSCKLL